MRCDRVASISISFRDGRIANPSYEEFVQRWGELTERELEITHVFWNQGELNANQVRDELAKSRTLLQNTFTMGDGQEIRLLVTCLSKQCERNARLQTIGENEDQSD